MGKFSVFDGISWYTVTGSTPINEWTHLAGVFNNASLILYVNGTIDGKLDIGPPEIPASDANVTIGAYQSTLRNEDRLSNYFSGPIVDVTVYKYGMVDQEVQDEYLDILKVYREKVDGITSNSTKIILYESLLVDAIGKQGEYSEEDSSNVLTENLGLVDKVKLKLNGVPILDVIENLGLSDKLTLYLNNQSIAIPEITNMSSNLAHSEIEIGKIVNWTQTVMLNDTHDIQSILVELPADAQNLQVEQIGNDGNTTDITEQVLEINETGNGVNQTSDDNYPEMSLAEIAHMFNVTEVIPLDLANMEGIKEIKQEGKPTKILFINETIDRKSSDNDKKEKQTKSDKNTRANIRGFNNNVEVIPSSNTETNGTTVLIDNAENSTEYMIKFTTQAPNATEYDYSTETKFQKNVTVGHNSTLHYTNVKAYSDIPEYLVNHNIEFNLHWMINDTKVDVTNDPRFNVTLVDTNGNGIADRMEWIIPQLSEQEFEIVADIQIINVQSYPTVGGNWTVRFTTIGTANLTITGIDGTTFGESSPDDLKFLELNNGIDILSPEVNLAAITISSDTIT